MYGVKMAAFLFARALHKTEDFRMASNVDGAGAFDDLVFRYRLREPNVWKTCFIQLKHKKNGGTIHPSSLTQMSGEFSLFKYFVSYCQIKASAECNLKQCGHFVEFEFVIYTNAMMQSNSALQGGDSDPVSILSSGTNDRKYKTFDEHSDKDIFKFFEELSRYAEGILQMEKLMVKQIKEKIKEFRLTFTRKEILDSLDGLQSNPNNMEKLVKELQKCDFSLYGEFLGKMKIFQCQSNENLFDTLIKKELQEACQASPSFANSIYKKFDEALRQWWEKSGNVKWLSENSHVWQSVKKCVIEKIKQLSGSEIEKTVRCDLSFNQQHLKRLSDAIQQNTVLNIIPNTKFSILSKLKTYQTLVSLNYKYSIFISSKSLLSRRKEVFKLWPCKWSATLVIDCEKQSGSVDENMIDTLVSFLRQYQQKVILISPRQEENLASRLREKLGNICRDYEDTCDISDLDAKSQKEIMERKVNFQGTNVALQTLVGSDPPDGIKRLIDSDVISILLNNKHKLCIGRQLGDHSQYYVPRVLQHHIYLKEDILKLTDNATTFAVSGLQADQLKKYLPAGEKIGEFVYDERENSHFFKVVADFSKPRLCAERLTKKTHHTVGQKRKSDNFRYIILGEKTAETDFRELKARFQNVHWIHMEGGSFLWRDSNCNIDIIRRHIDERKCKSHEMGEIMAHNDRTMLLVAEPGMGKSTFLSYMAHEIKKFNSSVWVLRINLHEYTRALESMKLEQECIDTCKTFLWSAAHSPEQAALPLIEKIFRKTLEQAEKIVILLDGFDEISPDYSSKVERLIREMRDKTSSKIWVSSRFSYRQTLEDIVKKLAFTLQPFKPENKIQFLKQYWNEVIKISKRRNLQIFAEELLTLCSQNFSDKDGEFTGIPLQMKMLGEAFVKEAEEYCLSGKFNLPKRFNLLYLFKKFTEKKCDIYFSEKNARDISKPDVKSDKKSYLKKHMIAALISLFSLSEDNELLGAINTSDLEQTEEFLLSGRVQHFGIITHTSDGKPIFIHRCFAEYFAAKWFTDNFTKCEDFISDILFNSTYEVTRNIFDRMLAEDSEIHGAILSNDISAVEEFLKKETDRNISDKGGRTALHLAASYNSPLTQQLLSGPGVSVNKLDGVLKWTPLKYADRTKSWMALDILLQNGANPDDMVFTRRNFETQEWGQRALWECASKGHRKLLEFMLNCGTDVNAIIKVPENILGKSTLLHIASFCCQVEVVRLLLDRRADINIRNANNDTALHCAAHLDSVDIIKLLLDKGISVNVTNTQQNTPLHISAVRGNLKSTIALVERRAALNGVNVNGYTPLMMAAYSGKLEVVRYFTETGPIFYIHVALLVAVERGHLDVIDLLLEKGAHIDGSHEERDVSPLILATLRQNLHLVKYLIQKGADVNPSIPDGKSKPALCAAARVGNFEITEYLLKEGADLNARDINSMTPIAVAVFCNNTKLALYLMEKGADVNVPDVGNRTPLHYSVWNNNLICTKRLVQAGANINYQGPRSVTALSMAVELDRIDIINMLVENYANINLRDDLGNTALHVAAGKGNRCLVRYLMDRGADVNIPNKEGNTPLEWIRQMKRQVVKENLLYARNPINNPPLNMKRVGIVMTRVNYLLSHGAYIPDKTFFEK